jgi:threonine aldolase
MVFVTMDPDRQAELIAYLKQRRILAGGYGQLRLVTHHDFSATDIPAVVDAVKAFYAA